MTDQQIISEFSKTHTQEETTYFFSNGEGSSQISFGLTMMVGAIANIWQETQDEMKRLEMEQTEGEEKIEMMVDTINNQGTSEKPEVLSHYVGGGNLDMAAYENVIKNGLQADHSDWSDVSDFVPNRPKGNFFWGEENVIGTTGLVQVNVSDLDTSKLWAFPALAAKVADMCATGRDVIDGAEEALKRINPVSFEDFDGSFAAEWIYTENIDAVLLKS